MENEMKRVIDINLDLTNSSLLGNEPVKTSRIFYTTDIGTSHLRFTSKNEISNSIASIVLKNLTDGSKIQRDIEVTDKTFSYILGEEIKHAGDWIGQVIIEKDNKFSTSRSFKFQITGGLLGVPSLSDVDDYKKLYKQLNSLNDDMATYLETALLSEEQRVEAEKIRNSLFEEFETNEAIRLEAETNRLESEAIRVGAETKRVEAETNRVHSFEEFKANEEIRKNNEINREENYELKIDSAIIESKIDTKVDNKVAELTPTIQQVTAQLAQTPKKTETGWATLNTFDEETRAVIQGLETGEINAVLGEGNVLPFNTSFFEIGKNKFDKSSATSGYKIGSGGGLNPNALYSASDFINITPLQPYQFTNVVEGCWYDSNKVFIAYYSGFTTYKTPPENATFTRISALNSALDTAMIEEGMSKTSYEPFKYLLPKEMTEKHDVTPDDIPVKSINYEKTDFVESGKNLHNPDKIVDGTYISEIDGTRKSNASYASIRFLEILPNKPYYISGELSPNIRYAWQDDAFNFISGGVNKAFPQTSPSNAKYISYSFLLSKKNQIMLEQSENPTAFERFGLNIPKLILNDSSEQKADEVIAFLPSELCVAVGRTIDLYNRQSVWAGNLDDYHIQWVSDIGRPFKRKWSFEALTANAGKNYPVTLNVYNNNMELVTSASTVVKVATNVIQNEISLLTIGDSLTNDKPWLAELRLLSGNKITNVGTRGGVNKHEGRSGFSANSYLTATSYAFESEGIHPFWDGTRFNYNHYKSTTGINPTAIQLFLGTNGNALDSTVNAGNIKRIVDYIRQDNPNIPIFVANTLYRGDQNGIAKQASNDGYSAARGQWKLEEDRKVFNLMVKLNDLLKNYSSLYFVPIALTHDSEYNFGQVATAVNPRSSITELQPTEATHPQTAGYLQMADIMFSTMAVHLQ